MGSSAQGGQAVTPSQTRTAGARLNGSPSRARASPPCCAPDPSDALRQGYLKSTRAEAKLRSQTQGWLVSRSVRFSQQPEPGTGFSRSQKTYKGPELRTVQSPRSHRRVPRQLAPGAPPTGAGLHSGAVRPRSPLGLSPASTTAQTDLRPSTPGLPLWCSERGTGQDCRTSDAATPFPAPTSAAWALLAPARRPSQGRQRHSRPTPPPTSRLTLGFGAVRREKRIRC